MRFSASASAIAVASLLVKDVAAVAFLRHSHQHTRTYGPKTTAAPVEAASPTVVADDSAETVTSWVLVTLPYPETSSTSVEEVSTSSISIEDITTSMSIEDTTTSMSIEEISTSTSAEETSTSTSVEATSTMIISSVTPTSSAAAEADDLFVEIQTIGVASVAAVEQEAAKPTTTAVAAAIVAAAKPTTLATAVKPTTTTAAAAQTSAVSSAKSGKRGLAYNSASLCTAFLGSSKVTWAYNWASASYGLSSTLEYVPLLWGLESDKTSVWTKNADAAIAAGSTHLMSFNEPDLAEQANIGYVAAAAAYLTYMQPYAGKAKLGTPAVTNGGSPMGLTYLANFITACKTCTMDFVTIAYFKSYVAQAYAAGGNRPIWITEFGASGSAAEQATFLATVLPWLDSLSYVERYAYFMVSDGSLVSGSALSTIGAAYASN